MQALVVWWIFGVRFSVYWGCGFVDNGRVAGWRCGLVDIWGVVKCVFGCGLVGIGCVV